MLKKISSILLSVILIFTLVIDGTAVSFANDGEYAGKIIVLHSNDVHGAIDGYEYMAGLKTMYESKGAEVILTDSGDYSQGTVYVSSNKGASAIEVMNATGYDYATLGNHEFDYGLKQLKNNLKNAKFKVLCANVRKNGKKLFQGRAIIKKDDVKIGFFGIDTPEAQTKANPALIKGVSFLKGEKLKKCIKSQASALKKSGADVVIALTHLGVDEESKPYRSIDLFKNAKKMGVDFVFDGHSHTVMSPGDGGKYSKYCIQSTGRDFLNIGVVEIDKGTKKIDNNELITLKDTDENYLSGLNTDDEVHAITNSIIEKTDNDYNVVFAKSMVSLNGEKAANLEKGIINGNRDGETNTGDLITDAMLWSVKSTGGINKVPKNHIVSINNGGGIRAGIEPGNITKRDVNTILPFFNTVWVVYVKGSKLLESLEASTYCIPESIGGFPQISGMKITINSKKKYDAKSKSYPSSTYYGPKSIKRVSIKSVNGKKFKKKDLYAVVTNDYCAAGGDTYYALKSAKTKFDTGLALDEVLMSYIQEKLKGNIGTQYAEPKGRIIIK